MPPSNAMATTGNGGGVTRTKDRVPTHKDETKVEKSKERTSSARGNGGSDVYDVSKSLRRDNGLRFRFAWQGHGQARQLMPLHMSRTPTVALPNQQPGHGYHQVCDRLPGVGLPDRRLQHLPQPTVAASPDREQEARAGNTQECEICCKGPGDGGGRQEQQ